MKPLQSVDLGAIKNPGIEPGLCVSGLSAGLSNRHEVGQFLQRPFLAGERG